jgi:Undecaprenyl-phosphate glucose phosphotransferase
MSQVDMGGVNRRGIVMSTFDVRDIMRMDSGAVGMADTASVKPADTSRKLTALAEHIVAQPVRPAMSSIMIEGVARAADILIIIVAAFGVFQAYLAGGSENTLPYLLMSGTVLLASQVAFQALHLYQVGALRSFTAQVFRVIAGWGLVFLIGLALLFFMKSGDMVSRVWFIGFFLSGLVGLLIGRGIIALFVKRMTRMGRLERRTALVGGGESAEALIRALEAQSHTGIRICGVFDDRSDDRSADLVGGYPKLGNVEDLVEFARRTRLDLVIFTMPISAEQRLLQMLRKLWVLPIDIRLAAHMSKLRFRPRSYSYIGAVPVLDVFDRPLADWDVVLKWAFDKVIGTLAIVALSPIMILTAIAIKLDSKGPVFFRQKRYGFNNEMVEVFKFRSMYVEGCDATASKLVTKDDPRVTRVGRFIRKTSLDELPQLFNVLFTGNLSLVGPRPHAVHAKAENRLYDQVVDGYFARHKVKPGITGWAQINGWRGETDTEDKIQRRVEHDLYYIENWSILFDLYILIRTPLSLMKTENAY